MRDCYDIKIFTRNREDLERYEESSPDIAKIRQKNMAPFLKAMSDLKKNAKLRANIKKRLQKIRKKGDFGKLGLDYKELKGGLNLFELKIFKPVAYRVYYTISEKTDTPTLILLGAGQGTNKKQQNKQIDGEITENLKQLQDSNYSHIIDLEGNTNARNF